MLTSENAPHSLTNSRLAADEQNLPLDKRDAGARELLEAANQQYLSPSQDSPDKAVQHALFYAEQLGFRVFPCHSIADGDCTCGKKKCSTPGKHPRTGRGFKDATCNPAIIRDWWTKWPDANVAIATGDGLVVIDVDPRNGGDRSFVALEDEFGPLPRSWQVRTGGGGWHHYLSVPPDVQIKKRPNFLAGIDIQAEGAYVIAPPGRHINGQEYSWQQRRLPSPADMPPELLDRLSSDPRKAQAKLATTEDTAVSDDQQRKPSKQIEEYNYYSVLSVYPSSSRLKKVVEAAIDVTVPITHGTRNASLVRLARRLKCIKELRDNDAEFFLPIVREWFQRALPNIRTKEWDLTWDDWLKIWAWTDPARSHDGMEVFWSIAQERPCPEVGREYRCVKLRNLVSLCAVLQELAADDRGVWYVSCRKAGELLGVSHKTANMWLNQLVRDGVIEKTVPHQAGSMKSQRYRYLGDFS